MQLPQIQYEVLTRLGDAGGPLPLGELVDALGRDQSQVTAACAQLADAGHLHLKETPFDELSLGPAGAAHVSAPLPERVIISVLAAHDGHMKLTEIPQHCELDAGQVGQSLRFLTQRGWAKKERDELVLSDAGRAGLNGVEPDEQLIQALKDGRVARRDALASEGLPVDDAIALLEKRKGFLNIKPRVDRVAELTDSGRNLLNQGISGRQAVTQLTPALLADGGWREVDLQPYDVTLAAKKLYAGKEHAFQRTLDRVRRVFLELGFEEIVSPWVESSFWDFDALFQPQDHPARDMQDTFYVKRPAKTKLPDDALVEHIRATHENGGGTGSTGWGYRWNRDLAHRPVLRTHTTAATIRALSRHTQGKPGKYFVIGPVFRRETVDYKHLPVFHQVDGIIVDPQASLATLLGTLKTFYQKMGFSDVHINPSFFPYTEPSAEVHVYYEERKDWVEMGGSGIFRPEVTRPLGIQDRVLAWGLGLERLAMLIHNLKSIGELYFATMPWLREEPLCRS